MSSANLCFEVSGILDQLNVQLGWPVQSFNFDFFYSNLTVYTAAGDPSRLAYDFSRHSKRSDLCATQHARNAARRACRGRFGQRDQSAPKRILRKVCDRLGWPAGHATHNEHVVNLYGPGSGAKLDLLRQLGNVAGNQTNALLGAYSANSIRNPAGSQGGVVRRTWSHIELSGGHNEEEIMASGVAGNLPPLPPSGEPFSGAGFTTPFGTTDTEWQGTTGETQRIHNQDYGYKTPYFECQAQGLRSSISLADQQFAAFMEAQKMPNISQIFENNRESMDLDVKQLQVAFLNTILLSPINGFVTGLYKNPGEVVMAGEPVMRVEDNSNIYVSARVVYRGPIVIAPPGAPPPPNSNATIQTRLFDNAPLAPPLTGSVVAARGNGSDDTWDLVVQCYNLDPSGQNAILPLGYHFDYDDTTFTIT